MSLFGSIQFLLLLLYDSLSLLLRFDGLVESLSVDGVDQVCHVVGLPSHPEHFVYGFISFLTGLTVFIDSVLLSVKPFLVDFLALEGVLERASVDEFTSLFLSFFLCKFFDIGLGICSIFISLCL